MCLMPNSFSEGSMVMNDSQHDSSASPPYFDAVIIGASISGLWTLHLLKQKGFRVLLIDACTDVGGSWQYHRYPGCGVDAELPYYEFSDQCLWREWTWLEKFPSQNEIKQYLGFVTEKLDLRPHLLLQTWITGVHWNDNTRNWNFLSGATQLAECQYFVSCAGYATIPYVPDFPGRNSFKAAYHTSRWPEDLDYHGKRVGIIGTGSSGVQCIEAVAADVKELVVFQRTPNLATPKGQEALTIEQSQELKKQYPELFEQRCSRTGYAVTHAWKTFDHSAIERQKFWEDLWQQGGSAPWRDNYLDLLTDKCASDAFYEFWRGKALDRIVDKRKAKILAPRDPPYAFGTRRPALETQYFEVMSQPKVHLVDLNEELITSIDEGGVHTSNGYHELDVLIYATGFDFITGTMLAIDVRGTDGRRLAESWNVKNGDESISTFLGLSTRGFPNMFFTMGPQAPTALAFTPHMAEVQGRWIAECMSYARNNEHDVVEATEEGEAWWKEELLRASCERLFAQTDSWYMGQNIGGRKKQPMCYFGGVDRYVDTLDCHIEQEYPGLAFY